MKKEIFRDVTADSLKLSGDDKVTVLEGEFGIEMDDGLEKEMKLMCNLSDYVEEVGMKKGLEKGLEQGLRQGIEALIVDNLEEHKTEEQILEKLMKRFSLSRQEALQYFDRFAKLSV